MRTEEAPGYSEAKAKYDGSVIAAKAAGSELDELRAEREWNRALDGFRAEAERATQAEAKLTAALADAKTRFPKAPEAVYSALQNPEAVLSAAQAAHDAIVAATPTTPPPSPSWPRPPEQSGASMSPPVHRFDSKEEWDKAMGQVRAKPKNSGGDQNNETLKEMREFVLERLIQGPRPLR